MNLRSKIWLNDVSKKFPRLREYLLKLAFVLRVKPVRVDMWVIEQGRQYQTGTATLAGKRRVLNHIRPSVSRYIEIIERSAVRKHP